MLLPVRLVLLACVLAVTGCANQVPGIKTATPVLLISIDGFRADYLDRGLTPTLSALAHEGVRAEAMRPSFPSLTFPNHYTLVTGLYPDHHGVVNNTMDDPAIPEQHFTLGNREVMANPQWWDQATPIWVTAQQQGLRSGTMFWPGSDVVIHGVRPTYWKTYDVTMPPPDRVDTVLGWLDLPEAERPQFLTLYFDAVDHAGHIGGPDSALVNTALHDTDEVIRRLIDGLKARGLLDRMNIVIVADHGMAATSPDRVVYLDELVDPALLKIVTNGVLTGIVPGPGQGRTVEAALLGRRGGHVTCWRKAEVPASLHYGTNPRIPPILCLADPGWQMFTHAALAEGAAKGQSFALGQHGYEPAAPDMAALFLAHGPAFRLGWVERPFDNVDVYPLLARLLGIKPEPNDGSVDKIADMLVMPGS